MSPGTNSCTLHIAVMCRQTDLRGRLGTETKWYGDRWGWIQTGGTKILSLSRPLADPRELISELLNCVEELADSFNTAFHFSSSVVTSNGHGPLPLWN